MLQDILIWGAELIKSIQVVRNPVFDYFFIIITQLGSFEFFMIMLPLLFWCVDVEKGAKVAIVVVLCAFVNQYFKDLWQQPRPFNLPGYEALAIISEKGFGAPSGHSQGSIVFWSMMGLWLKGKRGLALAIVMTFLVSFSRLYLGVHFPTDILSGWTLGLIIIAVYYFLGDKISSLFNKLPPMRKITVSFIITAAMISLDPKSVNAAAFLGMMIGYIMITDRYSFSADGTILIKSLRFIAGIIGVVIVYAGLKFIFPHEGDSLYSLFRFIRYMFLGGWVTLGAPLLFNKIKLSGGKI